MSGKPSGIVNIRGKDYQTVAYRVQVFRADRPDWTLQTEVLHRDSECVVIKASILDENGRLRATGHSEEYRKATQINKTSALENAETSAIGRALAALGIGGTEFASANEVQNAIMQQSKVTPSAGAEERIPEARRRYVEGFIDELRAFIEEGKTMAAVKTYQGAGFDADEQVYFWSFFDSKERAEMKKANEELKKEPT